MTTQISGTSVTAGSIDLTTPLAVVDGGTGITSAKGIAQIVTFQTGAVATGTSTIPHDNTIPQNTEGTEVMSLSITPTNASSVLEIDIIVFGNESANTADSAGVALFQDATANALCAGSFLTDSAPLASVGGCTLKHIMTAGTTSLTTLKVRAGLNIAGTFVFNGTNGSTQVFGGVMASRITIKEYLP